MIANLPCLEGRLGLGRVAGTRHLLVLAAALLGHGGEQLGGFRLRDGSRLAVGVDLAVRVGALLRLRPGIHCSPRHWTLFNSIKKGEGG